MQFTWIENSSIVPTIAKTFRARNGELYFKISIGDKLEKRCWEYSLTLEAKDFKRPISEDDSLELKNNYKLVGIIDKEERKQKVDQQGNYMYSVMEIPKNTNDKDALLFWILPVGYTDIEVNIRGNYQTIGLGSNGKMRNNIFYKSPCYVLELLGDVTLYWTGKNIRGEKIEQVIQYLWNEKRYIIKPMKELI